MTRLRCNRVRLHPRGVTHTHTGPTGSQQVCLSPNIVHASCLDTYLALSRSTCFRRVAREPGFAQTARGWGTLGTLLSAALAIANAVLFLCVVECCEGAGTGTRDSWHEPVPSSSSHVEGSLSFFVNTINGRAGGPLICPNWMGSGMR